MAKRGSTSVVEQAEKVAAQADGQPLEVAPEAPKPELIVAWDPADSDDFRVKEAASTMCESCSRSGLGYSVELDEIICPDCYTSRGKPSIDAGGFEKPQPKPEGKPARANSTEPKPPKTPKEPSVSKLEKRAATDGKCGLCKEELPSAWWGLCPKCNTERTKILFEGDSRKHMAAIRELNARALRTGDWTYENKEKAFAELD